MLKAIRMQLFQQMPNYRKPASFLVKESYPLPPYSSVIGMVHAACGWKEYHPMQVCVQGSYVSEISDLQTLYNFGIKFDPTRHQHKVENAAGGYDGINRGVRSIHLLTDVRLVLHIVPEQEEDYNAILYGLSKPTVYLSLGRHEDLIRIDEVTEVELLDYDADAAYLTANDIYIPMCQLEMTEAGTIYHLNKVFQIDPKTKQRTWSEVVKAQYVCKNMMVFLKEGYYDRDMNGVVCFA